MLLRLRLELDLDTTTQQARVVSMEQPTLPPWYHLAMAGRLLNPPPHGDRCWRFGCMKVKPPKKYFCSQGCNNALRGPLRRLHRAVADLTPTLPHSPQEERPCLG